GWIDPAIAYLATGVKRHPGYGLHLIAGNVGATISNRPHDVRRVTGMTVGTAANPDCQIERLTAFECIKTHAEQRVITVIILHSNLGCCGRGCHDETTGNHNNPKAT